MNRFRLLIARASSGAFLLLTITVVCLAQEQPLRIKYWLGISRPYSHLFEVTIEVELPANPQIESIDFQMPKWSPGRYAVFDFAKNIQEISAGIDSRDLVQDSNMFHHIEAPCIQRLDDQTWRVTVCRDSRLLRRFILSYKVFGNDLSGTFSQLDSHHANINGGCVFMYVVNHKQDPVSLSISAPQGWRIVNGRTEKKDQSEFQFPNWDVMIDTSTEIARDWTEDDFAVDKKTYHVVVHSMGGEGGKRPALVRDIEKIVRAETSMWGPPEFDSYTFLLHFANDGHSSDGMEHLTSTEIIEPGALGDAGTYEETLDAVAHEFFHVWNVKRLRPIELGPWDFSLPCRPCPQDRVW